MCIWYSFLIGGYIGDFITIPSLFPSLFPLAFFASVWHQLSNVVSCFVIFVFSAFVVLHILFVSCIYILLCRSVFSIVNFLLVAVFFQPLSRFAAAVVVVVVEGGGGGGGGVERIILYLQIMFGDSSVRVLASAFVTVSPSRLSIYMDRLHLWSDSPFLFFLRFDATLPPTIVSVVIDWAG